MKESEKIAKEIDELGEAVAEILAMDNGVWVVDLLYIAQTLQDLKQDYRIAKAREG